MLIHHKSLESATIHAHLVNQVDILKRDINRLENDAFQKEFAAKVARGLAEKFRKELRQKKLELALAEESTKN